MADDRHPLAARLDTALINVLDIFLAAYVCTQFIRQLSDGAHHEAQALLHRFSANLQRVGDSSQIDWELRGANKLQ